jgi:TonB family protein
MRTPFIMAGLLSLSLVFASTAKAGTTFAYVDSRVILTVEFSNPQAATLNLFNLTDYVTAFKAQDLLVLNEGNVLHIGQVIVRENPQGEEGPYMGSTLIKPWTYQGLSILGALPEPGNIGQAIVVLGGKRLSMVRLDEAEFDELASRVESLDLKKRDGARILEDAAIVRRGKVQYPTGEQDELDLALRKILGSEDINPPRLISRTRVKLTDAAVQAGVRGRVRLSVSLSRNGEIKEVKVVRGLGFGVDERAIEVVRNSWKFLPATKRSELVEVSMTVEAETVDP